MVILYAFIYRLTRNKPQKPNAWFSRRKWRNHRRCTEHSAGNIWEKIEHLELCDACAYNFRHVFYMQCNLEPSTHIKIIVIMNIIIIHVVLFLQLQPKVQSDYRILRSNWITQFWNRKVFFWHEVDYLWIDWLSDCWQNMTPNIPWPSFIFTTPNLLQTAQLAFPSLSVWRQW